jgi:hypothetical protein
VWVYGCGCWCGCWCGWVLSRASSYILIITSDDTIHTFTQIRAARCTRALALDPRFCIIIVVIFSIIVVVISIIPIVIIIIFIMINFIAFLSLLFSSLYYIQMNCSGSWGGGREERGATHCGSSSGGETADGRGAGSSCSQGGRRRCRKEGRGRSRCC